MYPDVVDVIVDLAHGLSASRHPSLFVEDELSILDEIAEAKDTE